jgi:group I intron endonuclease
MIIYKATNKINGKCYIGQTIGKLKKRKSEHLYRSKNDNNNNNFYNAINKYEWKNFKWEVLCECESLNELNEMEFHYIKQYDSYNNGYNLTFGGDATYGYKHTEETKKKLSKLFKGRKMSKEWKQKISASKMGQTGDKCPVFGIPKTEDHKKKIGKSHIGMDYMSKEWTFMWKGERITIKNLTKFCRENECAFNTMKYRISKGLTI